MGGGSQDLKKIAWVKWEGICLPKEVGGLGIKDITRFNAALLGTWIWALSSNQNQLWARILTSKYGGWGQILIMAEIDLGILNGGGIFEN